MNLKRFAAVFLVFVLMLAALPVLGESTSSGDSRFTMAPLSFLRTGQAKKKSGDTPVYASPAKGAAELARIPAGDSWEVIDEAGKYYRVRQPGTGGFGYVPKSQLSVDARIADPALRDALCDSLSLTEPAPFRKEDYLTLSGTIRTEEPVDTLILYVWDERLLRVERTYVKQLDKPASELSAGILDRAVPLNKISGGRKQIVLEGCGENETFVLFRSAAYISRELEEPDHITGLCGGVPGTLKDGKVSTAWVPTAKKSALEITLPADGHAALITLEWKVPSAALTITQLDETGSVISEELKEERFYMRSVFLSDRARKVILKPGDGDSCALSELRVYAEGYPGHAVQQWEAMPDKIDILLVSTHQDDEFLFFGGAIPYYSWRDDVTIGVLYMANCGRLRYREALNGLWCAGLKYHPLFLGLEDYLTYNAQEAAARWRNDEPEKLLTRVVRQYRPEVILVQDFNGEYGHAQHEVTAQLVADCLKLAEQEDFDPESAETFGAWSVKKCYVHLYDQNSIRMDWEQPLDDPVITPMFLAKEGFDKSKSQQAYFSMERQGVLYDNHLFGLYYSSVGPDVQKNDFMENITR